MITAVFFPSISMAQLQTISKNDGPMLNNNDEYNNYKSPKHSSFKKDNIECNNINLNLNGLDLNVIPGPLSNLLQAQAEPTGNPNIDTSTFDNDVERNAVGYQQDTNKDKDFSFTCINNNDNEFILPSIPVSQEPVNNVCTVWEDNTPSNSDIFFSGSHNNGKIFSTPLNISKNTNGDSMSPHIKCDGNNVYVVWRDSINDNFDIFFSFSHDGGQTFSAPDNLSNNTGFSFIPQISSEGNNVFVVWRDGTAISGNFDIFFSFSHDGGQTFSEPDNLSNSTGRSFDLQISSEGNNVYVVWEDDTDTPDIQDIFFARSTDGGQTFSTPDNISENTGRSNTPQISSEGNNVYVVWTDDTLIPENNDVFFARSTDGGQTFSAPDNLSENTGNSFNVEPQISSEGNNVYVVWTDDASGNIDIFFSFSQDGGLTFSEPDNLSENAGDSFIPQISSTTS